MNIELYKKLSEELAKDHVTLVAVSKTKPVGDILQLYNEGQRDFGENYVQELTEKQAMLPGDIRWHFIGHLQSNKVKYIAPFVQLIHGVDSFRLLLEIEKQAAKHNRVIDVLLQLYVGSEDTKFGMDEKELVTCLEYWEAQRDSLSHVRIRGLMGMTTLTEDESVIRSEFKRINNVFRNMKSSYFIGKEYFDTCSMGMSSDYRIAIEEGSTVVRIGSMLFGQRQ